MNTLVQLFGEKKVWLNWSFEPKKNTNILTKVPKRIDGSNGSSTDPSTWVTYKEAFTARDRFSGVGLVFEESLNIIGVDVDKCLNENKEPENEFLKEFIKTANTYTEISPSGKGLHLFFQGSEPFDVKANKRPVTGFEKYPVTEIYSCGRYFTFTGDIFGEE